MISANDLPDNTQLKEMQIARQLLNTIHTGYFQLDKSNIFRYINAKAEQLLSVQKEQLLGKHISELPSSFAISTGILQASARTHYSSVIEELSSDAGFSVSLECIPTEDGITGVLTEVDSEQIGEKLIQENNRLRLAQEVSHIGYFEQCLTGNGFYWSDELYRIHELEPQSEVVTEEDYLHYVHPDDRLSYQQQIMEGHRSDQPFEMSHRIITKSGKVKMLSWHSSFFYTKDGIKSINGTVKDITDQYNAKLAITESRDLLQSVFDTSLIQISVLKAVRKESGEIQDFRITIVNKQLELETQRKDLVGKLYAAEYPGIRRTGLFDLMVKVMETGTPGQMEYKYDLDGFDKWFSCMFVKVDDGLVATNLDINERKQAELKSLANLALLEQAESITQMGSWDYNLKTKQFFWSDGMYSLFNFVKNEKVEPEIYLQYATQNSLTDAKTLVDYLETGEGSFEGELEILVNGLIKILKISARTFYDEEGRPFKVIGVDKDITAQVVLQEEKNVIQEQYKQLETLQNQKIYRAALESQEEEKHRIAGSLNNGICQMLYGVKYSLERLDTDRKSLNRAEIEKIKTDTNRAVEEAIAESRRLSNELVPTVLKDFGLEVATKYLASQLGSQIKITHEFIGLDRLVSSYLKIVIYRTVEEVLSALKNLQTTTIQLKVEISKRLVSITVQHNGLELVDKYRPDTFKPLKDKLKLLKATFNIASQEHNVIAINIPNKLS